MAFQFVLLLNQQVKELSPLIRSTDMITNNEIKVLEVIELFRGRLSDEWLDEYRSLAEHGEWGVALENLCTQLYEFDVFPTADEYAAICEIGSQMGMTESAWVFLEKV